MNTRPKVGYKMYFKKNNQILEGKIVRRFGIDASGFCVVNVGGQEMNVRNSELHYNASELAPHSKPTYNNPADRPATDRQLAYLVTLGVDINGKNLTVQGASALIDAAKSGDLGSFGGFYRDGSN